MTTGLLNGTLVENTSHVNRLQSYAALLNQLCYFGRDSEIKHFGLRNDFFGESDLVDVKRDGNQLFGGSSPVISNTCGDRELHRQ